MLLFLARKKKGIRKYLSLFSKPKPNFIQYLRMVNFRCIQETKRFKIPAEIVICISSHGDNYGINRQNTRIWNFREKPILQYFQKRRNVVENFLSELKKIKNSDTPFLIYDYENILQSTEKVLYKFDNTISFIQKILERNPKLSPNYSSVWNPTIPWPMFLKALRRCLHPKIKLTCFIFCCKSGRMIPIAQKHYIKWNKRNRTYFICSSKANQNSISEPCFYSEILQLCKTHNLSTTDAIYFSLKHQQSFLIKSLIFKINFWCKANQTNFILIDNYPEMIMWTNHSREILYWIDKILGDAREK